MGRLPDRDLVKTLSAIILVNSVKILSLNLLFYDRLKYCVFTKYFKGVKQ